MKYTLIETNTYIKEKNKEGMYDYYGKVSRKVDKQN